MDSEQILKQIVCEEHMRELAELPSDEELVDLVDMSPKFQHGIKRLVNIHKCRVALRRLPKKVACLFLAVCAGMLLVCTVDGNARAKCLDWFRMLVEDGTTEYRISQTDTVADSQKALIGFELGYLPKGFELYKREVDNNRGSFLYRKADIVLEFDYVMNSKQKIWTDNEHGDYTSITLEDGTICEYYESNEAGNESMLVWKQDSCACALMMYDNGTEWVKRELIHMANEVKTLYDEAKKAS